MNPNYTHTITLYNRIRAADTQDRKEKWIRTVISGCFYKAQVNTSLTTQATVSNTYVARIPKNPRYLPYAEFIKKPAGCFTVSLDDIVVEGDRRTPGRDLQHAHHPDRTARLYGRTLPRDRTRQHGSHRLRPRRLGLHLHGLLQAEAQGRRSRQLQEHT